MPKVQEDVPESLRPYTFHGVGLSWRSGENAAGDCPFCGREGKFGVLVDTGQYRCVVCGANGNKYVFIRELLRISDENTVDYEELMLDRGFVTPDALIDWQIARSAITGEWLIPGWGPDGKLNNLYRYIEYPGGKSRALPTPTMGHQIFGFNTWDDSNQVVDILEGPWDGLGLFEGLGSIKESAGILSLTANKAGSIRAGRNVVAMPGCETFFESWLYRFADKVVNLWAQNDHPGLNKQTQQPIPPASFNGMKRVASMLANADKPPLAINYLPWGEEGYTLDFKHGYDIRDTLNDAGSTYAARLPATESLLGRLAPVPPEWLTAPKSGTKKKRKPEELELIPCSDWGTLVNAWRKAMTWTEGLDRALSVMLASIISTRSVGDQLWIQVISPPSSGKTVLCEALSTNKKYCYAKSTIRGFHSGAASVGGTEDHSLLAKVANKTLITKDGDTLLQSPNLGQILSEARDVYDTVSRSSYRTKGGGRDYEGLRMTWLLCGTSSLLSLDTSELGERFLKCIIMDGIDDDLEDEIALRVAHKAQRNMATEATGDVLTQHDPNMIHAMAMTGGYVAYLRENAKELLGGINATDEALWRCTRLGKFVSYMRARPSILQAEVNEREFAARLVSQTVRLTNCLAAVLGTQVLEGEPLRRAHRVAMDTSRGIVLNITRFLMGEDAYESESSVLAIANHKTEVETRNLLRFLRIIGAVETYRKVQEGVKSTKQMWKVSARVANLYNEVMVE